MDPIKRPAPSYRFIQRIFDLFLAGTALIFLSPALIAITVLVRMTSRGPALFRHKRVGLNGDVFTIFKFRTMVVHEATSLADKVVLSQDPRITRLGKILRDFHLDEVRQHFIIIRREMSIVGPRPLTPEVLPYYSDVDK